MADSFPKTRFRVNVSCTQCGRSTALPAPWPYPGFTCVCGAACAIEVAPVNPFDVSDAPRALRRVRPADGAHPLLVMAGYLCALFSLAIFPPALALSGAIFGGTCIAQRSTVNGILIVVLSLVCGSIGGIWGMETAFTGRPRFLLD